MYRKKEGKGHPSGLVWASGFTHLLKRSQMERSFQPKAMRTYNKPHDNVQENCRWSANNPRTLFFSSPQMRLNRMMKHKHFGLEEMSFCMTRKWAFVGK